MTDLLSTIPNFPTAAYTHLIPSLEKNGITVADLLTLDPVEIVKRCPLPLLEVRRLVEHVITILRGELGIDEAAPTPSHGLFGQENAPQLITPATGFQRFVKAWSSISTLDTVVDCALGGGIPTGYITEVTGER